VDAERDTSRAARALPARTGRRSRKHATHHWTRWLHVYTSMLAFVVVLFFGITGITLNHPSWTLGDDTERSTVTGTLPSGWSSAPVDYLAITEYVRRTFDVRAPVSAYGTTGDEGAVSFRGPGYAADLSFHTTDGAFELTVEQQGVVGVMNDLHKGRDTSSAWRWVIDVSGVFLVVVALTGIGLQLFLKKRRPRALVMATAGLVATVVFIFLTV
jgi:hypothetical protein